MLKSTEREVLYNLALSDRAMTGAELDATPLIIARLERLGLIAYVGKEMHKRPGRPANLYWPTAKGRRMANSLHKSVAA